MYNCYCPSCQAEREMKIVGRTLPWGIEWICQCSTCQQRFIVDPDKQVISWLLDYPPADEERAKYNRKMVAGHWFIEAYVVMERWLEEHPLEEWQGSPSSRRMQQVASHDTKMEKNAGISYPEER